MSEPVLGFPHSKTTTFSTTNVHGVVGQPPVLADGSRRKQQSQQSRQLLSCTKCRERKVKCDRMKPCSACCARGAPKDCHFIAEGGDYAPIQQSYELRKLRAENIRLKEKLRASKISIEEDESDLTASPGSQFGDRPNSSALKRRMARQRRFQGSEWSDSIYFGSPGLASVVTDFANINLAPKSTQSLAYLMPRGPEMYTPKNPPAYPFATLFKATPVDCIPQLLSCLPTQQELFEYLNHFEKRVNLCSFPHVPIEITKSEVERFLSEPEKNAQMCPDMLALLFAALALGSQHSVWDRSEGQWKDEIMYEELQKGNVYIAAAMQALRMASFTHRPTLLGIQALIMIGPYLTNSGRFLDAWTLFGTTIRAAHSIGLHRHPKYLDPTPPTQGECSIRQTLWWWMLHMDQEYSMTLGRPLGISGLGDCPPPHELTTDARILRFGEFINLFTLLARQILSSDRLTNAKIDEFTDSLCHLLETLPEMLQFDETWLSRDKEIPEWPLGAMAAVYYCKIHNYLILLNRQRIEKQSIHPQLAISNTPPPTFRPVNAPTSCHTSPAMAMNALLRGRPLVLSSSGRLLTAFLFFYHRVPAALICWTIGQQAFNSCMILLLDAMETGDLSRIWKVEKAYVVFKELEDNGVHELAALAVDRVSWGLNELRKMRYQADRGNAHEMDDKAALGTSFGRAEVKEGNVEMPIASGNEAVPGSGPVRDTVMGNTGMLLLEDPGLQSFVTEAFAPLIWSMAGVEGGNASPTQLKQEREPRSQEEEDHLDDMKPVVTTAGVQMPRSAGAVQGTQGSAPGSAPMRYATLPIALSQEHAQPQGLTAPTSPLTPSTVMQAQARRHHHLQGTPTKYQDSSPSHVGYPAPGHRGGDGASTETRWKNDLDTNMENPPQQGYFQQTSAGLYQPTPPHLRHHSYPSLHQDVPNPLVPHPPYSSAKQLRKAHPSMQRQKTATTLGVGTSRLQPLPELIAQPTARAGNPSIPPSWTARPAGPVSSVSESALSFPHVSHRRQATHAPSQRTTQRPIYQYTFPFHNSCQAVPSIAAVGGTDAEQMDIEDWRRWVESSGTA